jgi:single-strand DNA-binding protein
MAGDINQVILVGRITRDAELRYTASGAALCNFSIAVNRRIKKAEQWTDEASFFDLTLWDKQAENLNKYLVKGTQVAVQGELRQDRWEKDGQKFSKIQVFVNNLQLLGSARSGSGEGNRGPEAGGYSSQSRYPESAPSQAPARQAPQKPAADDFDPHAYEDDIPF